MFPMEARMLAEGRARLQEPRVWLLGQGPGLGQIPQLVNEKDITRSLDIPEVYLWVN